MCDPNVVVLTLLTQDKDVQALVQGRMWSPRLPTPENYRPDVNGVGVSLFVRGGTNDLYTPIIEPSFQVTAWGVSSKQAWQAQNAVSGVLHNLADQVITTTDGVARALTGIQQVYPQDVIDSDTGWFTSVSFYKLKLDLNY